MTSRLLRERSSPKRALCGALLALALVPALAGARSEPEGDGPWMVRAWFGDAAMKRAVASWGEHFTDFSRRGYLLLEADRERLGALRALGFFVDLDEERTAWIRHAERATAAAREAAAAGLPPGAGIPGFPCYRTVEESHAAMQAMAAAHPSLATIIDAGDSWLKSQPPGFDANAGLGYDMLVLRLTHAAIPGPKPKLVVTSSIHAREYTPAELVLRFAEELVAGYGTSAEATWLLDEHELHLMVHANPDGRKQAETGLLWRKNVNGNHCGGGNRGVDLNRNFGFFWGSCAPELGCSSTNACSDLFRGPAAASEPEIQAIQSYLVANFPDQRGPDLSDAAPADATGVYLDIHSSGQLILTPWGFQDPNSAPCPNGEAFRTAARKFAFHSGYDPSLFIYEVDGASSDFGYGELGIAASAWELGTSFFESCASFEENILRAGLPMLRYAAKMARTPFLSPSGPDVLPGPDLAALPGTTVSIAAAVDDARFSSANGIEPTQTIAAAEAFFAVPPWRAGATPIALAAADGAFDEKAEAVTGELALDPGVAPGRYLVYLRGRDASGAWGAPSALFVHVVDPATAPELSGRVRDAATGRPLAATVRVGPFATASDPATGAFEIRVPPGTYDLAAASPDHRTQEVAGVVLAASAAASQDFDLAPLTTVVLQDGESGAVLWSAQPPWALTTEIASSPGHSWTDSPGGSYGANANTSLTSPVIDLSQAAAVELSLVDLRDLEAGFDFARVEISIDGGAGWSPVATWDGESQDTAWRAVTLDLPALAGVEAARVRFRLSSDGFVELDGWHVDDIRLRAAMPFDFVFRDGFESGAANLWSVATP